MRHFSLLVGASALLAVGTQAQGVPGLGQSINGPAGSNWTGHYLNVQNIASANAGYTANGCLGVSWAPNNHYYVSARRNTASTANPHQLFEFDANGNWVAAYAQPSGTLGSAWGIRDLAWDGQSVGPMGRIYGGCENTVTLNKIFAFDYTAGAFDSNTDVTVAAPINGTTRALGIVPNFPVGGSTTPAFVITEWSGQVQYVDFSGNNIQPATPSVQSACYGGAYDRGKGTFWWFGQTGSTRNSGDGVVFAEMDLKGVPTGQSFLGDLTTFPGPNTSTDIAGGLELIPNPLGQPTIVYLVQAGIGDSIVLCGGRYEYAKGCGADGSFAGGSGAYQGNANFTLTCGDTANPIPAGVSSVFPCFGVPAPNPINVPIALLSCGISLNFALYMDCAPSVPPNLGQASFVLPIPASGAKGANLGFQFLYFNPNNGKLDLSEAGAVTVTN